MSAMRYLLVAVIAFAAAMAGVWAARTWRASPAHGEGQIHQLLHRDMTLDSRQQQRIAALEARFAQRRAGLEAQMRAINGQLAQAIEAEHGYGPRVAAAVDRSHLVMGQLQKETLQHVFAMRGVLRPDQAARFDATVARTLTDPPSPAP